MDPSHLGQLAAAATALLWTLSTLAWTSAGRKVGALVVSFLRLALTCVFLATYGLVVRGMWLPTDAAPRAWWLLGLSGFCGFFLADVCLFKAFLLIGPRLSLLVQAFTPPIAAVLSWLWLDEPLPGQQWLAMTVTVAGVAWVVLERGDDGARAQDVGRRRRGLWLALLAAVAGAVGVVLSRQIMRNSDYDPFAATFIRVIGAMVGYLAVITLVRRWKAIATGAVHARAMAIVACGTLVGPFLGVALCMVALRYSSAGVTATIVSTMPVLILPFAVLLYRERVSFRAAGGAALAVAGVALLAI
jgi:drug/metabolite transporter (DMT)-like permease